MGWLAVGGLLLGWIMVLGAFKFKHSLAKPLPESYHPQFTRVKGPLSEVSAKEHHLWKKIGKKTSLSCTLCERREPHKVLVKIKGEFESSAGSCDRNGVINVLYKGKSFNLLLKSQEVDFEGAQGILGRLDLRTGEISGGGSWDTKESLKGPDGSAYREVVLGEKTYYLCTWAKGKVLYSPLVVGELDEMSPQDQDLLLCLGALWHGVLNC